MRINLLLDNPGGAINGYVNIDPFADGSDERVSSDLAPLHVVREDGKKGFDEICDDAEASEIIADMVLTYFGGDLVDGILDYWIRKLRHGGALKIVELDLLEIVKAVSDRRLPVEQANVLLYGEQTKPWQHRKCMLHANQMAEVLKGKGLVIEKKRVNNFQFVVEAKRP